MKRGLDSSSSSSSSSNDDDSGRPKRARLSEDLLARRGTSSSSSSSSSNGGGNSTSLKAGQMAFQVNLEEPTGPSLIPMENGRLYHKDGTLVDKVETTPAYGAAFFTEYYRRNALLEKNPDYVFTRLVAGKVNSDVIHLMDTSHLRDLQQRETQLLHEMALERDKARATLAQRQALAKTLADQTASLRLDAAELDGLKSNFDSVAERWAFMATVTGFPVMKEDDGSVSHTPLPYWLIEMVVHGQYNGTAFDGNPAASVDSDNMWWQWTDSTVNKERAAVVEAFYTCVKTLLGQQTVTVDTAKLDLVRMMYLCARDDTFASVLPLRPDVTRGACVSDQQAQPMSLVEYMRAILTTLTLRAQNKPPNTLLTRDGDLGANDLLNYKATDATDDINLFETEVSRGASGGAPISSANPTLTSRELQALNLDPVPTLRTAGMLGLLRKYAVDIMPTELLPSSRPSSSPSTPYLTWTNLLYGASLTSDKPMCFEHLLQPWWLPPPPIQNQSLVAIVSSFIPGSVNTTATPPPAAELQMISSVAWAQFRCNTKNGATITLMIPLVGRRAITPTYQDYAPVIEEILLAAFLNNKDSVLENFIRAFDSAAGTTLATDDRENKSGDALMGNVLEIYRIISERTGVRQRVTKEALRATILAPQGFALKSTAYLVVDLADKNIIRGWNDFPYAYSALSIYGEKLDIFLSYMLYFSGIVNKYTHSEGKKVYEGVENSSIFVPEVGICSKMERKAINGSKAPPLDMWEAYWNTVKAVTGTTSRTLDLQLLGTYENLASNLQFKNPLRDHSLDTFAADVEKVFAAKTHSSVTGMGAPNIIRLIEIMVYFVAQYHRRATAAIRAKIAKVDDRYTVVADGIASMVSADYASAARTIEKTIAESHLPSSRWSTLPEILGRITLTPPVTSAIAAAVTDVALNTASPLYGVPADVLTGNTLESKLNDRDYIDPDQSQPGVPLALANAFADLVAARMNSTQQRWASAYNTREQNRMAADDLPLITRRLGTFRAVPTGAPKAWAVFKIA